MKSDLTGLRLPKVSIVICTYKRPKSLERLLHNLNDQKHTDFQDVEVVIVNDGSHHLGYEPLNFGDFNFDINYLNRPRRPDDLPTLYSSKNMGVAASNNEIIWLLDDDLIVDDHTLFILRQYFMLRPDDHIVLRAHEANESDPVHYQAPFSFSPQDWTWDKMRVWPSFAGLSLSREDWDLVDGIDEEYDRAMGFADLDLGLRLYNAGCNVTQVDGISVFIEDSETGSHRGYFLHLDGREHRNGNLFMDKWPDEYAKYGISR